VSGEFTVLTDMHSRQTPGVYVGYDTGCESAHSQVGLPGDLQPFAPRKGDPATSNWCIRVQLRKKPAEG